MDISKVLLLIRELEHGTSPFYFKLYFPSRSTTDMYSLTTISVHFLWNQVLLQVFNVSYQLLCIVSFIEADWHRYKLEWRQALSGTFMVIHR